MIRMTALASLALLMAAAPVAAQTSIGTTSESRWAQADLCMKQSIVQYPDRDWASMHRRDLYVDDCLAKHHLPSRQHLVPDSPP